jgi:tetratricopeptide (TPR) repeat protein
MTVSQAAQRAAAAYARGQWAESEQLCRQILAVRGDYFEALTLLGIIAAQTRRVEEAARLLGRAVAADPDQATAHNNYGNVLKELKRFDGALDCYQRALKIDPGFAEAHNNLGNVLKELKRFDGALDCYQRALRIRPDYVEALYNRGITLKELTRLDEALASYDEALALRPHFAEGLNNRGIALQELRRPGEALASYDQALALRPDYTEALTNRASALQELDRLEEALTSCDRALAVSPNYAEAHSNRGTTLHKLRRPEEALAAYDKSLAVRPGYAEALYNRGLASLLLGDFSAGWSALESRWDRTEAAQRRLSVPFPLWRGASLSGKKIIVYEEQGLGDVIQFSRYLKLLAARGARVTFVVRPGLLGLLRSLDPVVRLVVACPAGESFDYQSALLSLPLGFGTRLESIPAETPYLRAEPERVRKWKERLGERGFKVGIAWQGNKAAKIDHGRSFALAEFLGVAQLPNVRLISLQKHDGVEQLDTLPQGMRVETLGLDYDSDEDAFLDAAAVMESLDLVVSSDTSIAHLAGALGRPVWVALKHVPDWRWLLDRADSPWYPTVRLFRQRTRGDWRGVFAEMEAALRPRVGESRAGA